jgi:ELWxxDGT repeat protein
LVKTVALPTALCDQPSFHPLVNANGTLFFANGSGLWKSDGTAEGTILVKTGMTENPTSVNGTVFYTIDSSATTTSSRDLWISGTATNLLANDSLSEGVTTALGTGPANGTLVLRTDGTFTYRPNPSFMGTDRFTYTVRDGSRTSNPATVTISITPKTSAGF